MISAQECRQCLLICSYIWVSSCNAHVVWAGTPYSPLMYFITCSGSRAIVRHGNFRTDSAHRNSQLHSLKHTLLMFQNTHILVANCTEEFRVQQNIFFDAQMSSGCKVAMSLGTSFSLKLFEKRKLCSSYSLYSVYAEFVLAYFTSNQERGAGNTCYSSVKEQLGCHNFARMGSLHVDG